ncbi:pyridoxamine 5'-phosphate oxidase family protein [Streptomyces gamaensis]|uniref:Pyridoxamine 5'-phosphate oxidase family protein n=1 Tax=Streptomyces gamaensis TaxID=1763542 RepID=A0ABW0YVI7_9ACTN
MTTSSRPRRMVDVSGAEALYLLGGSSHGRLMYEQRDTLAVGPASHAVEQGRLVVRTPALSWRFSGRVSVTYHAEHIHRDSGAGWAVTVSGRAEPITDAEEDAHYRRVLSGWAPGPHDTLLRIHPQSVNGYRFAQSVDMP